MDIEALNDLDRRLKKNLGKSYVGLKQEPAQLELLSTGLFSLDWVLGGGLAKGRLIEIYGQSGGGKSTLSMYMIAHYQALGQSCLLIDAEAAYNERYARLLGIDTESLMLLEDYGAEVILNNLLTIAEAGIDLVVVDSVAALTAEEEQEKEIGENTMARVARLMSGALKQLVNKCRASGTTVIFINQVRAANLGGYGPSKTTTGGNALPFFASQRLSVTRKETLSANGDTQGIISTVKAEKNRAGIPFRSCDLTIYLPPSEVTSGLYGIDRASDLITQGLKQGLIHKAGAWFTYGDLKCQGVNTLREGLCEKGLLDNLYQQLTTTKP